LGIGDRTLRIAPRLPRSTARTRWNADTTSGTDRDEATRGRCSRLTPDPMVAGIDIAT